MKTTSLNILNPWDAAKKIKVFRCAPGYPLADLEPGVKFFVLMLEQIGVRTLYSCEGHPGGFYIKFSAAYETALRVARCGFFVVQLCPKPNCWVIRPSESVKSYRKRAQVLRWAADSWEYNLGRFKMPHKRD